MVTYKDIADFISRSEANIKYMKKHNPHQLELLKLGLLVKKLDLSEQDLINFQKIKSSLSGV